MFVPPIHLHMQHRVANNPKLTSRIRTLRQKLIIIPKLIFGRSEDRSG